MNLTEHFTENELAEARQAVRVALFHEATAMDAMTAAEKAIGTDDDHGAIHEAAISMCPPGMAYQLPQAEIDGLIVQILEAE